jgi:hypothetical protein
MLRIQSYNRLLKERAMPVWARSDDKSAVEQQSEALASSLLYRLTAAFPSWAGAIMAVYSIHLRGFSATRFVPDKDSHEIQ